jgi:hypothetical protein
MPRAFVIRPFGRKTDSAGIEIDFDSVHETLIGPALKAAGLDGGTTGEIVDAGNIREDMFALIIEADLVVCDVTVHNANVFYELGIRHALRKKRSVLIKGAPVADATPFDLLTDRYVPYDVGAPAKALIDLTATIRATLASDRETDSPVFKMLRGLPEVDPDVVQPVPTDFCEDVSRALAARSAGWLRLLACEVMGLRFQWPALHEVANAQWDLDDYDGARETWAVIRRNDPDHPAANLALANIFERQAKRSNRPELLDESNLAIARVLKSDGVAPARRAEAMALQARNLKTLWRRDFDGIDDLARRREAATNLNLVDAYKAYRAAYFNDLNHSWSGLAALQQGTMALELSNEIVWEDIFDDSDQASLYKSELKRQVEALRPMVSQAIEAALAKSPPGDRDRVWLEISKADLIFLIEPRSSRVVHAYRNAVPKNGVRAWTSTRGQLQLFAALGIRPELADEVIRTVDALVATPDEDEGRQRPGKERGEGKHVILFAGHRLDEAGRPAPRFPANRESAARSLIRDALTKALDGPMRLQVLASGAPGSDILCHELCRELGIASTICLPMPVEAFAATVFGALDRWRARFLDLIGTQPVLQLSDQAGLPRWLQDSGFDPWERANRWVLEMARTCTAKKVSLIAFWDGRPAGDRSGGTAHIVQLAREAGMIDVEVIDAGRLVS